MHVRLSILHACPSEYLTCTSVLVFYMYVLSEYLTYTSVLSMLHVGLFEYPTCTSILNIFHVRPLWKYM
jgi:hypothetical protein